ncbi:Uncharacterised protein [Serratia marcescens]|uniref:S-4TM family putative pore-forming effector n=1 Tax=Serratia marcescens TaxID=615 RepID=UPI00217ACDE5|nr:S-4TM family putative pore-forming effector [Serratia marcescens]CAI1832614.1 Uncharacterised protein [Serratia marcescens]
MNTIFTSQSTRQNLNLLYAQAYIYDKVKRWSITNLIFSVIVPLIMSAAATYNRISGLFDTELVSSLLALYGLLALVINIILSSYTSALRNKAASIQEMYDCKVLGIRRNELKVEEVPSDEISRAAYFFNHQKNEAYKRFGEEGWYVSRMYDAPQSVMALLCHGKNLGWDRSLRTMLYYLYLFGIFVIPIAILTYGIFMRSTLNEVLFNIVFILPLVRYFLLQFIDNMNSIKKSEKLKKYVDKQLSNLKISGRVDEERIGYILRNIQDELFSYRVLCPPVPNYIQRIMKSKNEQVYDDYFESNLKEMHLQK